MKFWYQGKLVTKIAQTDSGNIKVKADGKEIWVSFDELRPDVVTKGFEVFSLPEAA